MPLDSKVMDRWAAGGMADTVTADEDAESELPDEELPEAPAQGADPLWAGTYDGDLSALTFDEAEGMLAWLQTEEPDLTSAFLRYGEATSAGGDDEAVEQAREDVMWAEQRRTDDLPEMDEHARDAALTYVETELSAAGFPPPDAPEHRLAVACGIARQRNDQPPSDAEEPPEADDQTGDLPPEDDADDYPMPA